MTLHKEQTPLERTLRSHLWHPVDALKRATEKLPPDARNTGRQMTPEEAVKSIQEHFGYKLSVLAD